MRGLFLAEALLLAGAGTVAGLALAYAGVWLFDVRYQSFELIVLLWAPVAAAAVSLASGLVFGLLPARRAARLDPVAAWSGRRVRRKSHGGLGAPWVPLGARSSCCFWRSRCRWPGSGG